MTNSAENKKEKMPFRPLGKVLNLVNSIGLDVNHFYDDLVFVNNNSFILRYSGKDESLVYIHFNVECPDEDSEKIFSALLKEAKKEKIKIEESSKITLEQIEGKEELLIKFLEGTSKN